MISRHWKGITKPGLDERYIDHLKTHTLPELTAIPGFVSASILRRDVDDGTEFQVITRWKSIDAIRAFAGEDVEMAVVPEAAARLMTSFDRRVVHYEVVDAHETAQSNAGQGS
jgi:heme-degrading monooxygenase HmoA